MKRSKRKKWKMKYNVNIQKIKNDLDTSHEEFTVKEKICGHVEV